MTLSVRVHVYPDALVMAFGVRVYPDASVTALGDMISDVRSSTRRKKEVHLSVG